MDAYLNIFFLPSGCHHLDQVDGVPPQQTLHGDFAQVLCLMSKAKDGAIVAGQDDRVAATGQIVSCGESDPTDVNAAYVHFHMFGKPSPDGLWSYLLLPQMRSGVAGNQFVCPIQNGLDTCSVFAADNSNAIVIKEFNITDPNAERASECLWFAETTTAAFWRLYVLKPDSSKKLYMAADCSGRMFLTEDETLDIPREGMENPATNFRLIRLSKALVSPDISEVCYTATRSIDERVPQRYIIGAILFSLELLAVCERRRSANGSTSGPPRTPEVLAVRRQSYSQNSLRSS